MTSSKSISRRALFENAGAAIGLAIATARNDRNGSV
jgi:hypothetical protein